MAELVFKIEFFEGPLDLLVHLVRSKKVDVREIPISILADEFINYMRQMEELDIKLSAEFFSTASHLMYLKSKALIPKLSEGERKKFEEEKEKLYEMIERYSKIKDLVEKMSRGDMRSGYPVRVDRSFGVVDEVVSEMVKAAVESVRVRERVYRIKMEGLSVEEAMERIMGMDFPVDPKDVFANAENKYELIVLVLAILELIKIGKLLYENGRLDRVEGEGTR